MQTLAVKGTSNENALESSSCRDRRGLQCFDVRQLRHVVSADARRNGCTDPASVSCELHMHLLVLAEEAPAMLA